MSKIVLVLFLLLSRCSSAMNFTMEIFSTAKSGDHSLLSTTSLSENDILKLTRNNGLRRQTRQQQSTESNFDICEETKESLNKTELKRYLCNDVFLSKIKPVILKDYDEFRGINKCDRNLIIVDGTSQKIRTNCQCNEKYRRSCLNGGPHCTKIYSKLLCAQLAFQWEKLSDPTCNNQHKSRQACCVNKMRHNPRLGCKKIPAEETSLTDDHKTKVDFIYKVCENARMCNDDKDLTKIPFSIHLTNHEVCSPTLQI